MKYVMLILLSLFIAGHSVAQTNDTSLWHGIKRTLRYHPEGEDIVITNGNRRFTRALYGTNTAFRIEAGDLPEFALYMPGMGGNIKFGLQNKDSSIWLIHAANITARYRAGSMLYEIKDPILGNGKLLVSVLALADAEGMIIKMQFENVSAAVSLIYVYGGASGKKFSRDGDMGPDPESSFYLKPGYCTDNSYYIKGNSFLVKYGTGYASAWDPYVNQDTPADTAVVLKKGKEQRMKGLVPPAMKIHVGDAEQQDSPDAVFLSSKSSTPLITGSMAIQPQTTCYFAFKKSGDDKIFAYNQAAKIFQSAEEARHKIAGRVQVSTPDKYINTLGPVLSIAADAVWESPTFLHGAIGWRMWLNGWRGPYVGDVLGWHKRAKTHFSAYARSQITSVAEGPVVMDTALHLARSLEKMGTSVYSNGYISRNPNGDFRPHHYDMNLIYVDALLRHFKWTGDTAFAKEMWPVLVRHLAWEKRNFDSNDDGLYDAYAAIWASDALQYSGGSVTHSSAYNYKANKEIAALASVLGKDPVPFEKEAAKILHAVNQQLWIPAKGTYAEFKDLLGNQLLHAEPAVWTIYHSIDSDLSDPFQAYLSVQYITENIPHIPVRAKGLEEGYQTISTTNWMPYDWSLNNVATAEVMHTALAYWQAGAKQQAFNLWKSELLSTMYLGGSPGNIGQISFYDAARGEAYRDFADPVAMTARSLVEGLFGIHPDAMQGELTIRPGFPADWNQAAIQLPDVVFDFKRTGQEDRYTIAGFFQKQLSLKLIVPANGSSVQQILVNGKKVSWKNVEQAIGSPAIEINLPYQKKYTVLISWTGKKSTVSGAKEFYLTDDSLNLAFAGASITGLQDPQHILTQVTNSNKQASGVIHAGEGHYTLFARIVQDQFAWWQPVPVWIREPVEIKIPDNRQRNNLPFQLLNHTSLTIHGSIIVNEGDHAFVRSIELNPGAVYTQQNISEEYVIPGTNKISFKWENKQVSKYSINWNTDQPLKTQETIDLSSYFNDRVRNIFKNEYLSPRPTSPTLQLPTQGIGDWTHPLKTAEIDDRGLRKLAAEKKQVLLPQGIVFITTPDSLQKNIVFTSQWDNYPDHFDIPLQGKASHVYLLMAGSTNPMQSRIVNGAIIVTYTDQSADTLLLKNPENWWPIEQDYLDDGFAFTIDAPRPVRIHLKTGKIVSDYDQSIEAYNGKMIPGGAATVLDLPLNKTKQLKELRLAAIANDVVIGLMAVTLVR